MPYLNTKLIFLEHIAFVTKLFNFVDLQIDVKIIFDISTELIYVSSKWSVMFHLVSAYILIEKSNLVQI